MKTGWSPMFSKDFASFFSTYNANSELEFKKQSLIIYLLIHPKDIIWVTAQLAPQVHGCCSWRWCSKLQHLGAGCSYVYQVIFQPLAPIVTKQYKTIWNCQIMKSAENSKPRRTKNRSRFHLVFMVSPIWSLRSILLRPSLRVEEGGSGRGDGHIILGLLGFHGISIQKDSQSCNEGDVGIAIFFIWLMRV